MVEKSYYFSSPWGIPGDWFTCRPSQQSISTCCAAMHAKLKGIGLCATGTPGRQVCQTRQVPEKISGFIGHEISLLSVSLRTTSWLGSCKTIRTQNCSLRRSMFNVPIYESCVWEHAWTHKCCLPYCGAWQYLSHVTLKGVCSLKRM